MIVLESLFPIFMLIVLGRLLKRTGFVPDEFFRASDKLVYFIFFPAMLFWKISQNVSGQSIDWALPAAALTAIIIVFVLSTLYILSGRVTAFEAGSFSQSCYRFNTYIGMAIMVTALDDLSVLLFGVLIGFAIPVINVLSVSMLIWFSPSRSGSDKRIGYVASAILSNPLIIACCAGLLVHAMHIRFPAFIDNALRLFSMVTLPLALLSIGAAFSLKNLKGFFRLSLVAGLFKVLVLPLVGLTCLMLFKIQGQAFQVGMIFFCLPTSTAIYVLSAQLGSDTDLAAAAIVFSTLLSALSLTVVLLTMVGQ